MGGAYIGVAKFHGLAQDLRVRQEGSGRALLGKTGALRIQRRLTALTAERGGKENLPLLQDGKKLFPFQLFHGNRHPKKRTGAVLTQSLRKGLALGQQIACFLKCRNCLTQVTAGALHCRTD